MIKNEYMLEDGSGAERFGESYPLGNGHMGAMVSGGLPQNVIVLTENTFFSGEKSNDDLQDNAAQSFLRMRRLASEGKYREVHREAEGFIGRRNNYGTNLPAAKLNLLYEGRIPKECRLKRRLDIRDGTASRKFFLGSIYDAEDAYEVKEEYFISHPDNAMFIRAAAAQPTDVVINVTGFSDHFESRAENSEITFSANAFESMHCDSLCGVSLTGRAGIRTDGRVSCSEEGAVIKDMTYCIICIVMETDYEDMMHDGSYAEKAHLLPDKERFRVTEEKYGSILEKRLEKALDMPYESSRRRHTEDMHRCLEGTQLRIAGRSRENFLFAYARYLLNAASREDSKLPAHLQGIWNDNVACRIGWTCDMHLDINTQMNYWIAESTGLENTLPPLFDWISRALVPAGRKTAAKAYGLSGWVGEIVSNAWGYAAPYWASPIAPCPTGGVWILTHMWEHYMYTRDKAFLKKIYPVVKEAAEFFIDYIFEENGVLTCGPSVSPENSFETDGEKYQISNGCTYEILMIRELFDIYLKASGELYETGGEMYGKVAAAVKRLLPYRILKDGTIAEYAEEFTVPDSQHRHTSHLLGLFPMSQITPEKTPELAEAAEKTVASKLDPEDNFEETGWARSMLMLYEARLKHPERALHHLECMEARLLEPNGMIIHPPTRGAGSFDNVYELDGNTGLAEGITEMLMQSHDGLIQLLPALPGQWKDGEVQGLRARGGFEVSIKWDAGKVTRAEIKASETGRYNIMYNGMKLTGACSAGDIIILDQGGMTDGIQI